MITSIIHHLPIVNTLDLIDIIAHSHKPLTNATHLCGNRIDYILLSSDLAVDTTASGILPINNHIISDHGESYCDIDLYSLSHRLKNQLTVSIIN